MPDRGADTIGAILQRLHDLEARLSGAIDAGGSSTTPPMAHAHDAADVGYTPAVLADWDGAADPGSSADALDQIAERVDDLEGAAGHDPSEIVDDDADTGWEAEQSPDEDRLRGRLAGVETIVHFLAGSSANQLVKLGSAADPDGRFLWRTTAGMFRLYRKTTAGDDFDIANYAIVLQVNRSDGAIEFQGASFSTAAATLLESSGPAQFDDELKILGSLLAGEVPVTIAAGVIDQSAIGIIHTITGEGGVADTLNTITELSADSGWLMLLRCADDTQPITIAHGAGNILTPDGVDILLDDESTYAIAIRDESLGSTWRVMLIGGVTLAQLTAAIATHAGLADPHTGYVLESAHGGTTPTGHHARTHSMTTVSDHIGAGERSLVVGSAAGISWELLDGNIDVQKKVLVNWGDGGISTDIEWAQVAAEDVTIVDAAADFTATDVEGALAELQSDNESHAANADAHHARSHDHSNASDSSTLTPAILDVPSTASPAQTAEGRAVWDSDDDHLTLGDGSSRKVLSPKRRAGLVKLSPSSSENIGVLFSERAITIKRVRAVLRGSSTPSVTWNLKHAANRNEGSPDSVWSSNKTTTSVTSGDNFTSFDDATIPATRFLWFVTTAKSGTVDAIEIYVEWEEDP